MLNGVPVGSVIVAFCLPPVGALAGPGLRECLPLVQFLPRWFPGPDLTQEFEDASKKVLPVSTRASAHRKHWPMVGRQSCASFLSFSAWDLRDANSALAAATAAVTVVKKQGFGTAEW